MSQRFFSLYADSGFGELVPLEELQRGFADLQDELPPLLGELAKAHRKRVPLSKATLDDQGYPNLFRVHHVLADIVQIGLPGEFFEEFCGWMRRFVSLIASQPQRIRDLGHTVAGLAFDAPNPGDRMLGRFVVFELLCVAERAVRRMEGCHPELLGLPPDFIERTAEQEMLHFESDPKLMRELRNADDPIQALFASVHVFAALQMRLMAEELTDLNLAGRRRATIRKTLLEVFDHLPPHEAVLFRHSVRFFDYETVSLSQLRARHPLVLAGTTDNVLSQRKRRATARWHDLVRRAYAGEAPPGCDNRSLLEVLSKLQEECA